MRLKPKKIQKIIDGYNQTKSIRKAAKSTGIARNTAKKYLRLNGLLSYSYASLPHTGPPSLVCRYPDQRTPEQIRIQELVAQVQEGKEHEGNLFRELDKRNLEYEQKNQELATSKQRITQLTNDTEQVKQENQRLRQQTDQQQKEIEDLKQKNTELTRDKETETQKNKELYDKVNTLNTFITKILLDQKSEIIKLKNWDAEREQNLQNTRHTIQRLQDAFEGQTTTIENQKNQIKTLTEQKTKAEQDLQDLYKDHESDWIFNLIVDVLCFAAGIAFDQAAIPKIIDFIQSWKTQHGINTPQYPNPTQPSMNTPFDNHPIHYEATLEMNTSGYLSSGAFYYNNEETNNPGYDTMPHQQDERDQPLFPSIPSEGTSETKTFGHLPSGIFSYTASGTYSAGYGMQPPSQDNKSPPPIDYNTRGVERVATNSGAECSRTYVSSHLENNTSTSNVETPVYIPSSFQIPFNYPFIPLRSPLPDDLSAIQ